MCIRDSSDSIRYIGPVDVAGKNELFGRARALLHLNTIPERFGLVLVEANAAYYEDLARALRGTAPEPANWRWKRIAGKLWAAARLIKASFTFTGGADYIVWKIERHSGQKIVLTDWQRRQPVIAGLMLLPQLLRRGAVR